MITFLRQLFFEDFWLKLFSLVLATLVWFTVSFAIQRDVSPIAPLNIVTTERTFSNLPVDVVFSAEDARTVRVMPKSVEVTLHGEPKTLNSLQSWNIRVSV